MHPSGANRLRISIDGYFVNDFMKKAEQAVNNSDCSVVTLACSCMLVCSRSVVHNVELPGIPMLKPMSG
jgi:hypothetical protein